MSRLASEGWPNRAPLIVAVGLIFEVGCAKERGRLVSQRILRLKIYHNRSYQFNAANPAARRRPDKNSLRSAGLRQCMAFGTKTEVMDRSRSTITRASS